MISQLRHLLAMIRFSHTIFALPFALLAAVMAWTTPATGDVQVAFRWLDLLGILICMVAARSAAMAYNRLADRNIDAMNPRTASRHLPAGVITVRSALVFTLLSSLAFVAGTLLFLPNILPLILSGPVLLILMIYSLTKRFTWLAHFWLGLSLMLAPLSAWIAIRGECVLASPADLVPALLLGGVVLFWVSGFDMIYACQDHEFDVKTKLHSVPVKFGIAGALRLAMICHGLTVLMLIVLPFSNQLLGPELDLGWIYWTAVAGVAGLLAYEHALVRPTDLARVNVAFFNVNAIISMGLFLIVSVDLLT